MQHQVTHRIVVRACSLAMFAALASSAWAAPNETVDAGTASARSLFTAQHAIGAHEPAAQNAGAANDVNLDQQRGGTDTTTTNNAMHLDGSVGNNSATNVVTGSNSISAGSFANMSGIPVVIQNSGANVLIQNATIINLQLK